MNEFWKDVIGYEGLYQVSNFGRVKSLDRELTYIQTNQHDKVGKKVNQVFKGKFLTPRKTKTGRNRVQLRNKDYYIYRLVAEAFIRPMLEKEEVNHIDGDKTNDRLDNLEIVSRTENQNHAKRLGLSKIEESKKVILNGIEYISLGEASRATGISKVALSNRLKNPNIRARIKFSIQIA